jgi:PAS domain S-box-containing protein
MTDSDGRIVLANALAENLFGYSKREMRGRKIESLIPKRYRRGHAGMRDDYMRAPTARATGSGRDLFGLRKNGSEFPVEVGLNPVRTRDGLFVIASVIDISARKSVEEALRDSEVTLRRAQELARLGAIVRDFLDPARDRWSDEMRRIAGVEPGSPPPSQKEFVERFIVPEDRDLFNAVSDQTYRDGLPFDLEFRLRRADGALRYVRYTAEIIRDHRDKVVRMLGVVQDVTERRAMQKRLADSRVLSAIGEMVTVVAHEIRNPLNAILMAARAIAREDLPASDRAQVSSILLNESERLNRTLSDFLQLGRPREPRMQAGDLNAVARDVLAAAKADVGLAGRTLIEEDLAADLPLIPFDQDLMRQVLWNLVSNAFQALQGAGTLKIRTEARHGEAAIHVIDSGPGIPADIREKIFTPFFTTKTTGTGLGLPISRNIVMAHGGELLVESEPGRGTKFSVILPLYAAPAPPAP